MTFERLQGVLCVEQRRGERSKATQEGWGQASVHRKDFALSLKKQSILSSKDQDPIFILKRFLSCFVEDRLWRGVQSKIECRRGTEDSTLNSDLLHGWMVGHKM